MDAVPQPAPCMHHSHKASTVDKELHKRQVAQLASCMLN